MTLALLLVVGLVGLSRTPRAARRALSSPRRTEPSSPGTLRPVIVVTPQCHWDIPIAWWRKVAQPRFAQLVSQGVTDPVAVTYRLLEGETGRCPLPPSLGVQVDRPSGENYWDGPPTMLFLAQHVFAAVEPALRAVAKGRPPVLALPPGVLEEVES